MHKFTKILVMVEHGGVAYGVEVPEENLVQLLQCAAELSEGKTLSLSPMPNQKAFSVVFEKVGK